jgi:type I restriction enzyme S subunit
MTQPNAHKPGYKHTPLGWIPEEWEVMEIGEIGKLSSGTTPSRKEYELYFKDGIIPWVKTTDLTNSSITETEESVTELALNKTSLRVYPNNSILVAMYGGFNQIGRTGLLQIPATVNQALTAIQLFDDYDPKYILECLNLRVGYWKNFAGSSRKDPNITSKDVADFPIIVASLPEQRRISRVLSIWDEAIQKTQQLIEQLKQRNKGLKQQLLTGKKRLRGFNEKWSESTYDKLLTQVKRPVEWNESALFRLISVRRRSGGVFSREALYGHQIKVKDLRTTHKGDFLFSKMQIVHGASALVTDEFDGDKISGSYIAVVARNSAILNMEFFNWYSQLPYFYHQTYISSYGVHIEKMTFDFESFLSLPISLPSIKEQIAISDVLNEATNELKLYEQQLTTLQQQKKGLMQKLLSGEVRVKINDKTLI